MKRGEGFPGGAIGKEPTCLCRKRKRHRFNPWIRKIPWRRAWQPTPVFLPGESPWTEEPGGLQSTGSHRVRHEWNDLACRDTPMMCGECVVHSTSHSWRPSLTQIPQDQLWPQCPVSRQRKDSRERISLLNPKDVTHIASAYISLMRTSHMVPHNFKGVSEVWSLVKHLFLSNKSVWSAGSMNLW